MISIRDIKKEAKFVLKDWAIKPVPVGRCMTMRKYDVEAEIVFANFPPDSTLWVRYYDFKNTLQVEKIDIFELMGHVVDDNVEEGLK